MGRYENNKGQKSNRSRYAPSNEKIPRRTRKKGVGFFVIGALIIAASAGGFFLFRLSEGFLESDSYITSLLDQTIGVPSGDKKERPLVKKEWEGESTAKELGLVQIDKPRQEIVLPELDSSDDSIRAALIAVTPELAPYLKTDQIIRRYMQIANDFSQGIRVAKHLSFIRLAEPFSVQETGGKITISAKSYQRYDKLAQAIAAISAAEWLAIYKKFRPLMLQVFSEFSYSDGHNLDDIFIGAAQQILSAPVIEKPLIVVKRSVLYQYSDSELEALNPVHKQMLRMGPANTRLIQNKLAELIAELVNPRADNSPG